MASGSLLAIKPEEMLHLITNKRCFINEILKGGGYGDQIDVLGEFINKEFVNSFIH